jgi:hypothetical protein
MIVGLNLNRSVHESRLTFGLASANFGDEKYEKPFVRARSTMKVRERQLDASVRRLGSSKSNRTCASKNVGWPA